MRRKLKRKFKKKFQERYLRDKNKFFFPWLETIYFYFFLDDDNFNKTAYKKAFNKDLNLLKPETFNEKILWLKTYDRTSLHKICADKITVREYIKKVLGEEYLIPVFFTTQNVDDLIPEKLPKSPFIIKTNHDSGSFEIVRNKNSLNWLNVKNKFNKALNTNYYFYWREWQYKDIIPCIIVEKLLTTDTGDIPNDYKLFCFNGIVKYISVDANKETNRSINFYDPKWNLQEFDYCYSRGATTKKPKTLDKMIELAEKIATSFYFVRIDFYEVNSKIYFGEITFHPTAGLGKFTPTKWDAILGKQLKLPIDN